MDIEHCEGHRQIEQVSIFTIEGDFDEEALIEYLQTFPGTRLDGHQTIWSVKCARRYAAP